MKKMSLSYIAGFFDGEGCISISKSNRGTCVLQCNVTQKNRWIIELFKFRFGGHIFQHTKREGCWQWYLSNKKAMLFLEIIEPYLYLKKSQAVLAIEFQKMRSQRHENRKGKREMSDEDRAIMEAQRILMSNLKNPNFVTPDVK